MESGTVCVKPFNHLPFLATAIIGGGVAFFLAIAATRSQSYGLAIICVLFVMSYLALFWGYFWHIKAYRTHFRDYPYKPSANDLRWAMVIQDFILVCWFIFSAAVINQHFGKSWMTKLEALSHPTLSQNLTPARQTL